MNEVVSISLGTSSQDFAFTTEFLGQKLHVRRIGTNGSQTGAVKLIRQWDKKAAAIGIGVTKDRYKVGSHRFIEKESAHLKAAATDAPVTTGGRLGDILQEWAVRHAQTHLGKIFNNARVLFFSGLSDYKLAVAMSEFTSNLQFADPLQQLGVPKLLGSLDALRPLGMMVAYGNASGPTPPLDLLLLSQKGSLFVTRPTIMSYTAKRADLESLGAELFEVVLSGKVRIEVNQSYALKDAAQAHRDLEARKTTGSTILVP